MKLKLLLLSAFIIAFSATQSDAQTSTPATQTPIAKTQRAPVKKWRPRVKTQVRANTQAAPIQPTAAATIDSVKNNDLSLKGQYHFLLSRSRSINGYKLINPYRLNAVWKSVSDTLAKERAGHAKAKADLAAQAKTISALQSELKGNEIEVKDTTAKIDEIKVLGISFNKGTYNIIVWTIIFVLIISLVVVIARSAKNILEAKHRTQLYEEISAEYQSYKSKATEKERRLARELQDERNIIEEMKNGGKS
jgi:hypothetical protein